MTSKRYLIKIGANDPDRHIVKALGARWDPSKKRWYVPEDLSLADFEQWLTALLKKQLEKEPQDTPTKPKHHQRPFWDRDDD